MQGQLPSSWSQISIRPETKVTVPETAVTSDRKKRKRTSSTPAITTYVNQTKSEALENDVLSPINTVEDHIAVLAPVVLKPDKKMQKRITSDEKVVIIEIKKSIQNSMSQLPINAEKLDKMMHGMTYNLDQIVSSTNYRSLLKNEKNSKITYTNDIRFVSKSYEDNFLRQPINDGEKQCVRGNDCECMFIDKSQAFVGVEYVLPWENDKGGITGMCLPCVRATTQILFYDIIHTGININGIIQRFYNKHSIKGEYKLSKMLVCPPNGPIENLPMPIMRHQRNLYKVYKENKIYYMKQINVDFQ
jgi:hypothetical protein